MSRKTALVKDEILVSFNSDKLEFMQLSQTNEPLQILAMASANFNIEDIYNKNYPALAQQIKTWLISQNITTKNILLSLPDFYFFKKLFVFSSEIKRQTCVNTSIKKLEKILNLNKREFNFDFLFLEDSTNKSLQTFCFKRQELFCLQDAFAKAELNLVSLESKALSYARILQKFCPKIHAYQFWLEAGASLKISLWQNFNLLQKWQLKLADFIIETAEAQTNLDWARIIQILDEDIKRLKNQKINFIVFGYLAKYNLDSTKFNFIEKNLDFCILDLTKLNAVGFNFGTYTNADLYSQILNFGLAFNGKQLC